MYLDFYSVELTKKLAKIKKKDLSNILKSGKRWIPYWQIQLTAISSWLMI